MSLSPRRGRRVVDLGLPTVRAARVGVVAGGPALGLALLAVLSLLRNPDAMLLVLVGLLVVAPVGYLFDDPAAELLAASPTTLAERRLWRVGLGLPVVAAGWLAVIERGAFLAGYRHLSLGALSTEVLALGAFTLAVAALAAHHGDRHPGLTATVGLVVFVGLLVTLRQAVPAAWPVPELLPNLHHRRWWWVAAASCAVIAWASRDPAAGTLRGREGSRRSAPR